MTLIKLRFVHRFRDRHGKVRHYFRRGNDRVALPGLPGSQEFRAAYEAALTGTISEKINRGERGGADSVSAAITGYFASSGFNSLALETRRTWRNILERFRAEFGADPLARLETKHIDAMVGAKASTPASARNFLKALRALMRHCILVKWRKDDPTAGIKMPSYRSEGYRTWTEDDIAKFETRHAIGTRARLALALLLYTAQRRADVVIMGRQHVRIGCITVRQQKTGTTLSIPLHPALQSVLDATTNEHLTFLTTSAGKPFTAAGFTNWFRDMCNAAGLPNGTSAHGLRKAACRRLAEAGCSANEIAAISGHASLKEVARYTKAADQMRMAQSAIDTMVEAFPTKTKTGTGKPE
jgi:integrase